MLETFRNAWKIEDLRKRLLFTLLILVLFRLWLCASLCRTSAQAHLPRCSPAANGDMLGYLNMMSGGALCRMHVVRPGYAARHINASIIMQLLTVAIPYLRKPRQGRPGGPEKIKKLTRYSTLGSVCCSPSATTSCSAIWARLCPTPARLRASAVIIVLSFTAGAALSMDGRAASTRRVSATVFR